MATLDTLTRKIEKLEAALLKTKEDLRIAKLDLTTSKRERSDLERHLRVAFKENEKLAKRIHQLDNGAK